MDYIILVPLIVFFAMNMGASGYAPSMAAPYGAGFLTARQASLLFTLSVFIGAVSAGHRVADTLGREIIPESIMNVEAVTIVIGAATISLFIANLLKIPQSTSQVTVGALVGAAFYYGQINASPFKLMLPLWFALPVAAYLLVLIGGRLLYPRLRHYVLAQKLLKRYRLLQVFVLCSSCYAAFAIGSNNVANVVGPLSGAGILGSFLGPLLVAPLFGLGSLVLGRGPLDTVGKEITPLRILSATLVSTVSGTLLLLASLLGMPASEVQIMLGAVFGMGVVKEGHRDVFRKPEVRRSLVVWAVAPLISVAVSYLLFLVVRP